jgi:hypothetical protein
LVAERTGADDGKGYGLVVAGNKAVAGEEVAFVAFRGEQADQSGSVGLENTLVRPGNSDTCFDF